MSSAFLIIVGVIVCVTLIVAFLFVKFFVERSRQAIQPVADWTGNPMQTQFRDGAVAVSGRNEGAPFTCTYTPPQKSTPPYLNVTLTVPQDPVMSIRRRNLFDRVGSRLRFTRSMTTGAPDFDDQFYIDTPDTSQAASLLSDDLFRNAIARFFSMPSIEVRFDRDGVSVKQKLELKERVYPETVIALLDNLKAISRPADRTTLRLTDAPISGKTLRLRLGAPLALLIFVGIALIIVGVETYPTLYPSFWDVTCRALPWAVSFSAGYLLLAWLFAIRRTDRHLTIGMVLLLAMPAFYPATVGCLYVVNGFLDDSPAVEMRGIVNETYIKGRGGKKIRFTVEGRRTAGFDRPRGDFPRGLPVWLTVRNGYFRYPWVANWRVDR